MYAVIKTGGKQYRVAEGQTLKVEKIQAEAGTSVEFNEVMLVVDGENVKVGAPYIDGGKVTATVKTQGRGPKIEIVKFKRRKNYRRRNGHRQAFTEIRITGINTAPSLSK